MKLFYDFEFIEDGYAIEPISLGMVREDGETLYLVNGAAATMNRAAGNEWLYENVVTQLPFRLSYNEETRIVSPTPDVAHREFEHVMTISEIAEQAEDFIRATPNVQLWADYAAYDHVTLCQLWGPMSELPDGIPMFTHEFQQFRRQFNVDMSQCPPYEDTEGRREHHALFDALSLRHQYQWLSKRTIGVR